MITALDKCVSRFVEKHRRSLEAWVKELAEEPGLIIAISRKGPRLLELLVREEVLPRSVLRRVTTELALPFLDASEDALRIGDDGIWWGSTFNRVFRLAKIANVLCGGPPDVRGLPFAMSKGANPAFVRDCVSKHFLTLDNAQVAAFVNDQVSAFRLLGCPFDVEHPVVSFAGDFGNEAAVPEAVENAALRLGGKCIEVSTVIPTTQGPLLAHAWTVLLDTQAFSVGGQPQLVKIRAYLDAEHQRLTVAAMQPIALAQQDMRKIAKCLPGPLGALWYFVADSVRAIPPPGLASEKDIILWQSATEYSLVMWASLLNGMVLLRAAKDAFGAALADHGVAAEVSGPTEGELRLLIGPRKAKEAESILAAFLTEQEAEDIANGPPGPKDHDIFEEIVPSKYAAEYFARRVPLLDAASSEGDVDGVMRAIFHAQHLFVEGPSRNAQTDPDERLDFGICFGKLRELVLTLVPTATDTEIHRSLDRLIDEGCVVPRYLRLEWRGKLLWVRMFRVGEGPVPKLAQTVRLLFGRLSKALGTDRLPRLLFEKYCVLALSNAPNDPALEVLRSLETYKRFHLYGARQAVTLGSRVRFLLDWAQDQRILLTAGPDDEAAGEYALNGALETSYPSTECPWDEHTQDAMEDLALFSAKVVNTKSLGPKALVLLTSVATPVELKSAIEAELDLWLHDRHFSVYHAIQALGELTQIALAKRPSTTQLGHVNSVLWRTANFSAQVAEKMKLNKDRSKICSLVGTVVEDDTIPMRVWRGLSQTLDSRLASESRASGFVQIVSALRVAYATNRLLRDLLAHAGYVDPKHRSEPVDKSIAIFRNRLNDSASIEPIVRGFFTGSDGGSNVDALAAEVLAGLPCSFPDAFNLIRPVVLQVATRCEDILRAFGSEEFHEIPMPLVPPQYIFMWDIRGSTEAEKREDLDPFIETANKRLLTVLKENAMEFRPESRDDGNGMVCPTFASVLNAFRVLVETYSQVSFRAGVEVNMQGQLNYYPKSKTLAGRAFEHAARIAAMFKEIDPKKGDPERWSGGVCPAEPGGSYLVVGEFARRHAEVEGTWPPEKLHVVSLPGQYTARVHHAIPVTIHLVVPPT